jgi:predicted dehydrogenase
MSNVRVAVVGVGYWGPNLVRTMFNNVTADLVAVCDSNASRLERITNQYPGVEGIADIETLLNRSDIDAVVIALPASLHHEVCLKFLRAGKHCFVEKPLALTTRECQDLIDAAEQSNVTLMVGHTFEYNAAVRAVKALIDDGSVGDVYQIISQRLNLGQVRSDVNALWNLSPHDISIALYWLGGQEPKYVRAEGFCHLRPGSEIYDSGSITMEMESGTVVNIMASWLSPEKIRKISVIGSNKMVVYDDVNVEAKIQIFDKGIDLQAEGEEKSRDKQWGAHDGFGEFQLRIRSGDLLIPNIKFTEPLVTECSHFLDCVINGTRPLSDGANGLRVTKVLEASDESIRSGGKRIEMKGFGL